MKETTYITTAENTVWLMTLTLTEENAPIKIKGICVGLDMLIYVEDHPGYSIVSGADDNSKMWLSDQKLKLTNVALHYKVKTRDMKELTDLFEEEGGKILRTLSWNMEGGQKQS